MKKFFLFLAILLFLIPVANAQVQKSTYQYAKIYLNPFYRASMSQNVNYTYNVYISPPDGISEVKSALIFFQIYITPTVEFYLWVNNKTCNPPSFLVHTTYMDVGYSIVAFDCSNVIDKEGNYTIVLQPRQANTGSSIGWVELTYVPRKVSLNIFGTEYVPFADGKVFVQFFDSYGNPINDAFCVMDMFRPNNTILYSKVGMSHLNESDGIYYFDFVAPEEEGVYPISVSCTSPSEWTNYLVNGFALYSGREESGTFEYTWNLDGLTHLMKAPVNFSYYFNYTNANFTNKVMSIEWYGYSAGGTVNFYFFNCSSNSFEKLPNGLSGAAAGKLYHVSNTIFNYTCPNFFIFNVWANKDIQSDYVVLRAIQPQYIQYIRGGGEIHITNIAKHIDENLNLTYYLKLIREKVDELRNLTESVYNKTNLTYEEVILIKEKANEIYELLSLVNYTASQIKEDTNTIKEMIFQLNSTMLEKIDLAIEKLNEIKSYLNSSLSGMNDTLEIVKSKIDQMISTLEEIESKGEITIDKLNSLIVISNEIYNISNSTLSNSEGILLEIGEIKTILSELNVSIFVNITGSIENVTEGIKALPIDVWKQFLKLGTPPLMPSTEYYCKDNATLVKNLTFEFCENHKCDTYSRVEEIKCDWGCDSATNSCAPNPFFKYLIVILAVAGIMVLIYLLFGRRFYGY